MPEGTSWSTSHDKPKLIVLATRELFEEIGVKATSISKITRRLDITRELFYYYFANKTAVSKRVVESYADDICNDIKERVSEQDGTNRRVNVADLIAAARDFLYDGDELSTRWKIVYETGLTNEFIKAITTRIQKDVGLIYSDETYQIDVEGRTNTFVDHMVTGAIGALLINPQIDGLSLLDEMIVYANKEDSDLG